MDKKEILEGDGHVAIHDWAPFNDSGVHKTSSEIENDIQETRHTMDEILDTLANRIQPRTLVDRFQKSLYKQENRDRIKKIFYDTGNRINESFQRNPLPVIMLAAGATWLLWDSQRKESTERPIQSGPSFGEKAKEAVSSARNKIEERLSSAKERAEESYSPARERAQAGYEEARSRKEQFFSNAQAAGESYKQKAAEFGRRATDSYRGTMQGTNERIHENSLLFGAAALLGGLIAGVFLPETRREQEAVGEKARETLETAKEKGQEAMERGKEFTRKTTQAAKDNARQEGFTPEQMTRKAEGTVYEPQAAKESKTAKEPQAKVASETKPVSPLTTIETEKTEVNKSVFESAEQKIDEKKKTQQ